MVGLAGALRQLTSHHDLTAEEAEAALSEILQGDATPSQIAGFIVALRMKGETVAEMTGMVRAMLAAAELVPLDESQRDRLVDTCGTGGSGGPSLNVSTMASFVVAGAGVPVCKHGNRAASSSSGSADVLEALGVKIDLGPDGVAHCIAEAGIGFCFAPRFHPAMRHAGPTRRELGVRTVFNFLGPLANPGRVRRQVVGVSDPAMARNMVGVLVANGAVDVMVVHGDDGLDELSITGPSTILRSTGGGEPVEERIDPVALGLRPATTAELDVGDAAANAELTRALMAGKDGVHRDIVLLNAAAALVVGGGCRSLAEGLEQAAASVDGGQAATALERLVAVSND